MDVRACSLTVVAGCVARGVRVVRVLVEGDARVVEVARGRRAHGRRVAQARRRLARRRRSPADTQTGHSHHTLLARVRRGLIAGSVCSTQNRLPGHHQLLLVSVSLQTGRCRCQPKNVILSLRLGHRFILCNTHVL